MIGFLTYDLKVAVLIAVFYMFYRLLLSRETFHRVNRVVLLATAVASFVLPLCVITLHRTVVVSKAMGTVDIEGLGTVAEAGQQLPLWQIVAIAVFFMGMTATLGFILYNIVRVWLLVRSCEQHRQADGTVICISNGQVSPFSWMHYIVLSRNDYHIPPLEESGEVLILAHERGHIRAHHSLDLILVDTLTALQWFNPAMWMLRQDLRAIHEYEADAAVLSQGINMRQYQYLLIQKAVGHCGYSVANGISHSTLKNRITMMLNKKSNRARLLKLFALAPIVGAALALQAETVNDYVYNEPQTPQKEKVVKKNSNVFDVVEQMPQFPGGASELMKYLSQTVKYPAAAEKAGIQGRVIATFVVEADGSISDAKVVRKVNDDLDAEALRVIRSMPKWTPGMQSGKPVRVKYTIPITFKLDNPKAPANKDGDHVVVKTKVW